MYLHDASDTNATCIMQMLTYVAGFSNLPNCVWNPVRISSNQWGSGDKRANFDYMPVQDLCIVSEATCLCLHLLSCKAIDCLSYPYLKCADEKDKLISGGDMFYRWQLVNCAKLRSLHYRPTASMFAAAVNSERIYRSSGPLE